MFNWALSFFIGAPQEEVKDKKCPALSSEDCLLKEKIVSDLFAVCSKARVNEPDSVCPAYAIIFRESASWKDVDLLMDAILDPDQATEQWIKEWRTHINDLRDCQRRVHNHARYILQLQKDPSKIDKHRNEIAKGKKEIVDLLDGAKRQLQDDAANLSLTRPEVKGCIRFLEKKWNHLTVFGEWAEVPMDETGFFVQVRAPKNPDINLSQFVNLSTKGIFMVEEYEAEKRERNYSDDVDDPLIMTVKRTTELQFKKQCIGPITPSPSRKTEDKFHTPTKSSKGDRMFNIVNRALDEVNFKLKD